MNMQTIEDAVKKARGLLSTALPFITGVVSAFAPGAAVAMKGIEVASGIVDAIAPIVAKYKTNAVPTQAEWEALDAAVNADHAAIQNQVV